MTEGILGPVTAWFALSTGLFGVVVALLLYAVRERFRGGVIGRGFSIWVLSISLWAVSMLQEGIMEVFLSSVYTELIHHVLMATGLVTALLGTYTFYSIPNR